MELFEPLGLKSFSPELFINNHNHNYSNGNNISVIHGTTTEGSSVGGGFLYNNNNNDNNNNDNNNNNNNNNLAWPAPLRPLQGLAIGNKPEAVDHCRRSSPAVVQPHPHSHRLAGTAPLASGSTCVKRQRSLAAGGGSAPPPLCRVAGCRTDLSSAKEYHRRHKVCEKHAKAPLVRVDATDQRFCQQCSRFHMVGEFDDAKRSCRRRLATHNERRRKSTHDSSSSSSSMGILTTLVDNRRSLNPVMEYFLPTATMKGGGSNPLSYVFPSLDTYTYTFSNNNITTSNMNSGAIDFSNKKACQLVDDTEPGGIRGVHVSGNYWPGMNHMGLNSSNSEQEGFTTRSSSSTNSGSIISGTEASGRALSLLSPLVDINTNTTTNNNRDALFGRGFNLNHIHTGEHYNYHPFLSSSSNSSSSSSSNSSSSSSSLTSCFDDLSNASHMHPNEYHHLFPISIPEFSSLHNAL